MRAGMNGEMWSGGSIERRRNGKRLCQCWQTIHASPGHCKGKNDREKMRGARLVDVKSEHTGKGENQGKKWGLADRPPSRGAPRKRREVQFSSPRRTDLSIRHYSESSARRLHFDTAFFPAQGIGAGMLQRRWTRSWPCGTSGASALNIQPGTSSASRTLAASSFVENGFWMNAHRHPTCPDGR